MAQTIKLKRTAVQGKIPNTTNLELGELALNTYDGRIFFQKNDGSPSIQEILTTNTTNSGSLNLDGALSASSLNITGNTTIGGDLTLEGQLTIGDASTDSVNVIASLSSSLIPNNNLSFDIGSTSRKWSNSYIGTSNVDVQNIIDTRSGQNYSLTIGANSTGDRFHVATDNTANAGIILSSRNATNTSNQKLSFSGSAFEFGGGDVKINGNLELGGNITIGDESGDTISLGGEISTNIIPSTDNTLSLGSSTKRFQLNGGTPVTVTGSGAPNTLTRFSGSTEVENSTITNTDTLTEIVHSNDGDIIFTVSGSNGELLTVTDSNTGNLLEVNDTSGIDVFSISANGDVSASGAITASAMNITGGISISQVATVTSSFDNQSTINVSHNFDTYNVIVSTYDTNYNQLIPQTVSLTDTNTVQVVLSAAHSGHVVVAKGGHVVSGSTAASNITGLGDEIQTLTSYREDVSGASFYSITHNLNESYPFVQAWNTSNNTMELPIDVESTSVNAITVSFSANFAGKIIVKK